MQPYTQGDSIDGDVLNSFSFFFFKSNLPATATHPLESAQSCRRRGTHPLHRHECILNGIANAPQYRYLYAGTFAVALLLSWAQILTTSSQPALPYLLLKYPISLSYVCQQCHMLLEPP